MKRNFKTIFSDAVKMIWSDIKNIRVAIAVLALYFFVGHRFLYSLCPSVLFLGIPCPACGMTRAVFSILKGHFLDAWRIHPFAYVLFAFAGVFAVRRYILRKDVRCLAKYAAAAVVLMVFFYVYRMIRYFPGEPPMSYYYGSFFWKIKNLIR